MVAREGHGMRDERVSVRTRHRIKLAKRTRSAAADENELENLHQDVFPGYSKKGLIYNFTLDFTKIQYPASNEWDL